MKERKSEMNDLLEFEYRGLNLLDEISTVEISIDKKARIIHIFDQNNVVEPEFYFSTKEYKLTDSFYQMAQILLNKKFILLYEITDLHEWINQFKWIFYGSRKVVLIYDGVKVSVLSKIEDLNDVTIKECSLSHKYVQRL